MIKLTKNCYISDESLLTLIALTISIVQIIEKNGLPTPDQLYYNIKDTIRQQFDLFILKYSKSPETRREIEKEMKRITVEGKYLKDQKTDIILCRGKYLISKSSSCATTYPIQTGSQRIAGEHMLSLTTISSQ